MTSPKGEAPSRSPLAVGGGRGIGSGCRGGTTAGGASSRGCLTGGAAHSKMGPPDRRFKRSSNS